MRKSLPERCTIFLILNYGFFIIIAQKSDCQIYNIITLFQLCLKDELLSFTIITYLIKTTVLKI
jgi:hypothetical protein